MIGVGALYSYVRERIEQIVLCCCYHYPGVNALLDRVMVRSSKSLRALSRPCNFSIELRSPDPSQTSAIVVLPLLPPGVDDPFALLEPRDVCVMRFVADSGKALEFQEAEREVLGKAVSFRRILLDCLRSAPVSVTAVIAYGPTAITRLLHNTCGELGIPFVYIEPSPRDPINYRKFSPPLADSIICERAGELEFHKLGYYAERLHAVDSREMLPHAVRDIVFQRKGIGKLPAPMERLKAGGKLIFPVIATNRGIKAATGEWQQKYIGPLFQAVERLAIGENLDPCAYIGADVLLQWGPDYDYRRKNAVTDLLHCIQKDLGIPRLILENAFISSFDIGLNEPAKGVIVDDRAPYYHAGEQSRLMELLESDWAISGEERRSARRLIDRIVSNKITKYNHASRDGISIEPVEKPKILIVDQVFGDASIIYGGGDGDVFRRMLVEALENTRCDVVLKLHPEAMIGGRGTNYSSAMINSACAVTGRDAKSVNVVKTEINPYALLDCVEKVYVVTSGMGFEALLAGKDVTCFGRPFYSGWGITTDRRPSALRRRKRSLEEVFHAACVLFSIYCHPEWEKTVTLDDYLDYFISTLAGVTSLSSRC